MYLLMLLKNMIIYRVTGIIKTETYRMILCIVVGCLYNYSVKKEIDRENNICALCE